MTEANLNAPESHPMEVLAGLTMTAEYLLSAARALAMGHDMKSPQVADCLRWAELKFGEVLASGTTAAKGHA